MSQPTSTESKLQILVLVPGSVPQILHIENSLEAMQGVVGGLITTFATGIEGVIGVANDEAIVDDMPFNLINPATGEPLFGTLFLVGDAPPDFVSLSPLQIAQCYQRFAQPLHPASTVENTAIEHKRIEVLVLPPTGLPVVQSLAYSPIGINIKEIRTLLGVDAEAESERFAVASFAVASFDLQITGTVGLCLAFNTQPPPDGYALDIDTHRFRVNHRVEHLPYYFYGTFIVAATSGGSEVAEKPLSELELLSLTPQQLENLLDTFAPELEASQFEQVMHGHSQGAQYMANWD